MPDSGWPQLLNTRQLTPGRPQATAIIAFFANAPSENEWQQSLVRYGQLSYAQIFRSQGKLTQLTITADASYSKQKEGF